MFFSTHIVSHRVENGLHVVQNVAYITSQDETNKLDKQIKMLWNSGSQCSPLHTALDFIFICYIIIKYTLCVFITSKYHSYFNVSAQPCQINRCTSTGLGSIHKICFKCPAWCQITTYFLVLKVTKYTNKKNI